MKPCDEVTERVALGDPIGELAEHVATCERCQRLTALPGELAAVPHETPPSAGFTARMTVGAQHVLAARRRRRIVGSVAAATAVAAGAVFVVTRSPDQPEAPKAAAQDLAKQDEPAQPDDLKALVKLARVDRASHASARWSQITKPLAPYKALVKGVKP
jgi:hypothetical protein